MNTKKFNLYLGEAGQLFAMSEFLARGWNVAVPQVDVGDDILVVRDKEGIFYRVQVKTGTGKIKSKSFSTQFSLNYDQLIQTTSPELYYFFAVRFNNRWQLPLIISRENLLTEYNTHKVGTRRNNQLLLYFSFIPSKKQVICSKRSFNEYVSNWADFPVIHH